MKKNKFTLIILALFITLFNSCGFKKLTEVSEPFTIENISVTGSKKYAYVLKNNILLLSSKNQKLKYNVRINISEFKESKIKDSTGKTTRYNLKFDSSVELKDANNNTYIKFFSVANDYEVSSSYSDTIRNERDAIENNINLLLEEIKKYIQLINLS